MTIRRSKPIGVFLFCFFCLVPRAFVHFIYILNMHWHSPVWNWDWGVHSTVQLWTFRIDWHSVWGNQEERVIVREKWKRVLFSLSKGKKKKHIKRQRSITVKTQCLKTLQWDTCIYQSILVTYINIWQELQLSWSQSSIFVLKFNSWNQVCAVDYGSLGLGLIHATRDYPINGSTTGGGHS